MSNNKPSSTAEFKLGRLEGKVALVTGGANEAGFGAAISRRFVSEGAKVLIGDLDEKGALAVAKGLSDDDGGSCKGIKMNVCQESDWKAAVDTIVKEWGGLDIVVNNAGTTYRNKPTAEVTDDEWERVFKVNVKSIFWSAKVAIPQVQKRGGGSIINIASIGSIRPRPGLVWYNSSKAAVSNATKGLAAEYGPDQIRVNAICPLLSGTGLFESFVGVKDTPENRKKYAEAIPLQRLTEPQDVANAAVYLASDEGKFITGVNLEVDGGRGI
ncbi:hypothetical protein AAFC00_000716 [Neodothiora populina]|uniref:Uncharacterized protein n=1 Tax=Neodothiora populina TaxID=2781224 RepID=A0ABR3PED2_9PEZI